MDAVEGKVAVVTGGASGIGRAMATRFAAAGMHVVLADIEKAALDATVEALAAGGADVIGVPTDVSSAAAVEALRDATLDRFGAVHVVCNNAGVGAGGLSWEQSIADWEWVLGVNLWGVIHGVRTFMPLLVAQGEGHMVNTASMAGLSSPPMMGSYNVSKHAVVTLSETIHGELGLLGSPVGVSVLCPGWVNTRIHEAGRNHPGAMDEVDGAEAARDPEAVARGEMFRDTLGQLIATGLDPAAVADIVLDAVLEQRFYLLTHPEWKPMISRRVEAILTETDPPSAFLPMGEDDAEAGAPAD